MYELELFGLDADHNYRVSELVHETMEVEPLDVGFKEFIGEKMLLGPDGSDQKRRKSRAVTPWSDTRL